ncbi:hypothetical protein LTR50_005427 [Elasticomyces elasticus]|nr:hypothetical protein LTR50_005427 [Elasticomyces elasticus]
MSKVLLITGATGKQGGAVIDALVSSPAASQFTIVAVTRDANGGSAQKLASKSSNIKISQGNLDDVPGLFAAAKEAVDGKPIWGVYSVQISLGKGVTMEGEIKQGCDMVDESVKNGVKHFVYSSVERGGDEASWNNPTPIGHFQTKHKIEHHLRDNAGQMGWTILRPVAFMDNLVPGFPHKVFLTALRDTLQGKPLQWVATNDIGFFAAAAFEKPEEWNHKAIGLAGDELTFDQLSKAFENTTGSPAGTTFSFLGSTLKYMAAEMGTMVNWFGTDGYKANVAELRKINPNMMNFETWLQKKSAFQTK